MIAWDYQASPQVDRDSDKLRQQDDDGKEHGRARQRDPERIDVVIVGIARDVQDTVHITADNEGGGKEKAVQELE